MRARERHARGRRGRHAPRARALGGRPRAAAGSGADGTRRRQHPRPRGGHARREPLLLRSALGSGDVPARRRRRGRVPAGWGAGAAAPIAEFVVGPYQTSLEQGELLTAVRIPALPEGASVAHAKFSFHERPTATVACLARVVGRRPRRGSRRRWVGGRAACPVARGRGCPDGSARRRARRRLLATAGERAAEDAAPVDDATGSADYKAQLVKVLVERTFREALA